MTTTSTLILHFPPHAFPPDLGEELHDGHGSALHLPADSDDFGHGHSDGWDCRYLLDRGWDGPFDVATDLGFRTTRYAH